MTLIERMRSPSPFWRNDPVSLELPIIILKWIYWDIYKILFSSARFKKFNLLGSAIQNDMLRKLFSNSSRNFKKITKQFYCFLLLTWHTVCPWQFSFIQLAWSRGIYSWSIIIWTWLRIRIKVVAWEGFSFIRWVFRRSWGGIRQFRTLAWVFWRLLSILIALSTFFLRDPETLVKS